MYYNIAKLSDVNPDLVIRLKKYCYAINGCCLTVHTELGPFLNEYIYQDALEILLCERHIKYEREYHFAIDFHGRPIKHTHSVDFLVDDNIIVECKAVETLCIEHRQQLWNYMRLTKKPIGILYNFSPIKDQSEHYFFDHERNTIFMF
ncbi:MAG: GxxExxY protein [Bacteroidales bacterium]|nr:GxxExxY protein [Bacteroidales bacterium]